MSERIDNKKYRPNGNDRTAFGVAGGMVGGMGGFLLLGLLMGVMEALNMYDAAEKLFSSPMAMGIVGSIAGGSIVGMWLGGKHAAYDRIYFSNAVNAINAQKDELRPFDD